MLQILFSGHTWGRGWLLLVLCVLLRWLNRAIWEPHADVWWLTGWVSSLWCNVFLLPQGICLFLMHELWYLWILFHTNFSILLQILLLHFGHGPEVPRRKRHDAIRLYEHWIFQFQIIFSHICPLSFLHPLFIFAPPPPPTLSHLVLSGQHPLHFWFHLLYTSFCPTPHLFSVPAIFSLSLQSYCRVPIQKVASCPFMSPRVVLKLLSSSGILFLFVSDVSIYRFFCLHTAGQLPLPHSKAAYVFGRNSGSVALWLLNGRSADWSQGRTSNAWCHMEGMDGLASSKCSGAKSQQERLKTILGVIAKVGDHPEREHQWKWLCDFQVQEPGKACCLWGVRMEVRPQERVKAEALSCGDLELVELLNWVQGNAKFLLQLFEWLQ